MRKYICLILLLFSFLLVSCKDKKESEVEFKYSTVNMILGDEKIVDIVSTIDITSVVAVKENNKILNYEVDSEKVVITASEKGSEDVVIKVNDDYEIKVTVNVVGEKIFADDFFNKEENDYYVMFYKDNCSACEKAMPYVLHYLNTLEEGEMKVYFCKFVKGEEEYGIHHSYTGENGEGKDGKYFVTGVTKYEEMCVYGTPTLIKVSKGVAYYEVSGSSSIINYFER